MTQLLDRVSSKDLLICTLSAVNNQWQTKISKHILSFKSRGEVGEKKKSAGNQAVSAFSWLCSYTDRKRCSPERKPAFKVGLRPTYGGGGEDSRDAQENPPLVPSLESSTIASLRIKGIHSPTYVFLLLLLFFYISFHSNGDIFSPRKKGTVEQETKRISSYSDHLLLFSGCDAQSSSMTWQNPLILNS